MKVYYQVNSGKLWLFTLSTAFLVTFLLPIIALAGDNDVSLQSGTQITANGITVTASQSGVASITVSGGSFSVNMGGGSAMEITSSGKNTFTVDPSARTESFTCGASTSVLLLRGPSDGSTATVTVTPSSTTCSSGGGGGSSGGGGGGGGGGGSGGASVVVPATTKTVPATTVANPSAVAQAVSPVFTKVLQVGNRGSDVKRLQQLLNSDPDTRVTASGVGSAGKETETFGPATTKAVQKFQLKYKIAKPGDIGFGNLGPKTRAKFAEVFKTSAATVPAVTPTSVPASTKAADSAAIQKQISDTLKLIQELQAKIKAKSS